MVACSLPRPAEDGLFLLGPHVFVKVMDLDVLDFFQPIVVPLYGLSLFLCFFVSLELMVIS
jgi:hypothetical protein